MQNSTALTLPEPVTIFSSLLEAILPKVQVEVDHPRDANGEWWIDVECDDFRSSIAWRPNQGFGIFTSAPSFAERPDEIYQPAGLAAKRMSQLADQWRNTGASDALWLHDLRQLCDTPQTVLAEMMSKSQAAISKLERREDIRLSSLSRYLEAMGGRLEMRAVFDDFSATVDISSNEKPSKKLETKS